MSDPIVRIVTKTEALATIRNNMVMAWAEAKINLFVAEKEEVRQQIAGQVSSDLAKNVTTWRSRVVAQEKSLELVDELMMQIIAESKKEKGAN